MRAVGTFEVTMNPDPLYEGLEGGIVLGRLSLTKQFKGDLEGSSIVQMLSAGTSVKGSAGYVAIERVTGTLAGRKGTFALQHWGMMDNGTPDLKISVIPDSGTGELAGLSGTMTIDIQPGGKHFYVFTYTLPATK